MSFVTFRRHYLDRLLAGTGFSGDVLDVGGEREGARGSFRAPASACRSWRTVNVDPATKPDLVASADELPVEAAAADVVLLAETLEHLERPEAALAEAARVLRPRGKLVLSVPFLYAVHGDPHDFQRWTPAKLRVELTRAGFAEIEVRPMGGFVGACADVFEAWCQRHYAGGGKPPFRFRVLRRLARGTFLPLLLRWDETLPFAETSTGGYFVTARKP